MTGTQAPKVAELEEFKKKAELYYPQDLLPRYTDELARVQREVRRVLNAGHTMGLDIKHLIQMMEKEVEYLKTKR